MKAFVVSVNGQQVCTAGIGTNGVLSTTLSWIGGRARGGPEGHLHFHVGGLDSQSREHVRWDVPKVNVGDTITITIVEADRVDPEARREPPLETSGNVRRYLVGELRRKLAVAREEVVQTWKDPSKAKQQVAEAWRRWFSKQ